MKKETLKPVVVDLIKSVILGLLVGWAISLLRENAPPFYFGGIVLGGYSLIKSYLNLKSNNKVLRKSEQE